MWKGRKLSIEKVIIHSIYKISFFPHEQYNCVNTGLLMNENYHDVIQKIIVIVEDEILNRCNNEFTRST
jgi:hypothetical protein